MEKWVAERMATLLPQLEPLTLSDEEQIKQLCEAEIQVWKERPEIESQLSLKRPLRNARKYLSEQLVKTADNSYVNRDGEKEHLALKYLTFAPEEWRAMNRPTEKRFHARLTHQLMISRPDEILARIEKLLESNYWEEVAAGLCCAVGRRVSEVLRFGTFGEKSLYSVMFAGQRKNDLADEEFEIPTLVPASLVVAAWQRLRRLRDFSGVATENLSGGYSEAVRSKVAQVFGDVIEKPEGRTELYTAVLRAVYPRLCIFYYLPPRVSELAFVAAILGHTSIDRDGEREPNYMASLYYMSYKVCDANGVVDSREGVKLTEPGVEMLEQFKPQERVKTMAEMAETQVSGARTKIGVNRATKAAFDEEQKIMGCETADEAVAMMVRDHQTYRWLRELLAGASMTDLIAVLGEVREIALEHETPLDCLRAAVADKKRFRSTYEKRTALNAERDYGSMSLGELRNMRTIEASRERWRRAVVAIMAYNDDASIPELRWYINAAAVKALTGGRGAEIGRYLKAEWQDQLDAHHAKYGLRPGHNHARTNIRERVYGEAVEPIEDDEE